MLHKDMRVDGKKLPNEEGLEKIQIGRAHV